MNDEAKPAKKAQNKRPTKKVSERPECFVMMPVSARPQWPEHPALHWSAVYEQIFFPAIEVAGYTPFLASNSRATNFIQLDILKRLIEAPMALCDISTHNPNVLFELGVRQAFNKPVVIVAQEGTEKISDISPLRYNSYSSSLSYVSVIRDQKTVTAVIEDTKRDIENGSINSLVKLLSLQPAEIPKGDETDSSKMLRLIYSAIMDTPERSSLESRQQRVKRDWTRYATSAADQIKSGDITDAVFASERRLMSEAVSCLVNGYRIPVADAANILNRIAEGVGLLRKEVAEVIIEIAHTTDSREQFKTQMLDNFPMIQLPSN